MTAAELLDRLERDGYRVTPTEDGRIRFEPRLDNELRMTVLADREAFLKALRRCAGCGERAERLTSAYWNETERFCPHCCELVATKLTAADAWPTPPWIREAAERIGGER